MKPRLRLQSHVWSCASYVTHRRHWMLVVGYGYTPQEAYEDWKARC